MASKGYEDAIAQLRKAAEGDDEEAAKAKRMLAAELAEADPPAPKKEGDGDDPPPKKEEDEEAAKARAAKAELAARASVSVSTAGALAVNANALEQRLSVLEKERETDRVTALLGSRVDLAPGMRALLASKPLAEVTALLAQMPPAPPKPKLGDHAAAASVAGTQGVGQGDGSTARLAPEAKLALDVQMGLVKPQLGVEHQGSKLILGAVVSSAPQATTATK